MCLAIPGQIVDISDERPDTATVDVQGVRRPINIGLLDDVCTGDWVLIHVGFAMSKVDEEEAKATLELLAEIGEAYDEELQALSQSMPDGPDT